jgi:hypothetical protein
MNAWLLGAGFSFDLGMPLTSELSEVFLNQFNEEGARKSIEVLSGHQPFSAARPVNRDAIAKCFDWVLSCKARKAQNYESVLASLQELDFSKTQSDKDSCSFVFGVFYELIHGILSQFQIASYETIYPENLRWFSGMASLLSDRETWVFSLNHDLCLECLSIDYKVPLTYGGSISKVFPISNIEMNTKLAFSCLERTSYKSGGGSFFRNQPGINLVKLHGGLSEIEYDDSRLLCNLSADHPTSRELINAFKAFGRMGYFTKGARVITSRDHFVTNQSGEPDLVTKAMLTGGKKYSQTAKPKPGEEKLGLFDDILATVDELTIIGYGFGDEHVNARIAGAMHRRRDLRVQVVDPKLTKVPQAIAFFDYDGRVKRAQSGAPLWMSYSRDGKWDGAQMKGLAENERLRAVVRARVESAICTTF